MSGSSPVQQTGKISPQTEWADILRAVAIETFATMAGITALVPEAGERFILTEVVGMVGIAGHMRAMLSLRCSLKSATMISSRMLRVSFEEAASQKCDAVGEICNIIAGSFKAKAGLGDLCSLSVPTVLAGTNYQIHSPGRTWQLGLPLMFDSEEIWIALDIRI